MKQRRMGRTNLHVSELCLDVGEMAESASQRDVAEVLNEFCTAGGNFIQCAAPTAKLGALRIPSEDWVGQWQSSGPVPRDKLVLATRVELCRPVTGGSSSFVNMVRASCEQSLRRMKTSYLDVIVCEWREDLQPIEDALEAFDILVRAGLVRYIVAGDFMPWRVVDAISRAGIRNRCRFEALQREYALQTLSRLETEALAMCQEYRIGFIARPSLSGGIATTRPPPERMRRAIAELACERAVTPEQIALARVLTAPQVTAALVGPAPGAPLADLVAATGLTLTAVEQAELSS